MIEYRQNTPANKAIFQSSRVFYASGNWYFSSREQSAHGPYETQQLAQKNAESYRKSFRH